ncbi:MAG: PEP-CTERM sorting domain-containing protein [Pirellula sp.]
MFFRFLNAHVTAAIAFLSMLGFASAEIVLVGGFFSGAVDRVNTATGATTLFSQVSSGADAFPGISGLAYNPISNTVYATARVSKRVYLINPDTGNVTGFRQLDSSMTPAGITVDANGFVYVANNAGNSVVKYDSGLNKLQELNLPDFGAGANLPSGLAFDPQGNLIISTFAGAGVVKYNPNNGSFSSFNSSNPTANGMVAIDQAGNAYVGGAAFSNSVTKLDSNGAIVGSITITESLLPKPPQSFTSPDFTSPAGVAIESNGNIVVAALGRTNPFEASDNFQNNGGVFVFSSAGTLLASNVQTTPYSSALRFTAVPEPTSLLAASVGIATLGWLTRRRKTNALSKTTDTCESS